MSISGTDSDARLHLGRTLEIEDLGSANWVVFAGGRASVPTGTTIHLGTTLLVVDAGAETPDVEITDARGARPPPPRKPRARVTAAASFSTRRWCACTT